MYPGGQCASEVMMLTFTTTITTTTPTKSTHLHRPFHNPKNLPRPSTPFRALPRLASRASRYAQAPLPQVLIPPSAAQFFCLFFSFFFFFSWHTYLVRVPELKLSASQPRISCIAHCGTGLGFESPLWWLIGRNFCWHPLF